MNHSDMPIAPWPGLVMERKNRLQVKGRIWPKPPVTRGSSTLSKKQTFRSLPQDSYIA